MNMRRRAITSWTLILLSLCLWGLAGPGPALSQEVGEEKAGKVETSIRIEADRLETSYKTGWVEFIGHVKAQQ